MTVNLTNILTLSCSHQSHYSTTRINNFNWQTRDIGIFSFVLFRAKVYTKKCANQPYLEGGNEALYKRNSTTFIQTSFCKRLQKQPPK